MGVTRRTAIGIVLLCITVFLSACAGRPFQSNDQFLNDVFSEAYVNSTEAYYLSKEGTLYCTGVNTDASAFAAYQNKKSGIVAENVKKFDSFVWGGCYIDSNDDLYMWNKNERPLYGYRQKEDHVRILKGVKDVVADSYCLIYIDLQDSLFLLGSLRGEDYSIDNPKLLATNVACADVDDGTVIWATHDGKIDSYGKKDDTMLKEMNTKTVNSSVRDIQLSRGYVAVLSEEDLWYYGDYEKLITGEDSNNYELKLISSDIVKISTSFEMETIMALNTNDEALIWGKSFKNDTSHAFKTFYCEGYCVAKNVENVNVSSGYICYIDKNGKTNIFYRDDSPEWYGNTTNASCVGINSEPITWVSE